MPAGMLSLSVQYEPTINELQTYGRALEERFVQGVQLWAEMTMTLAKAVYVPVVTGVLRASGYVSEAIPYPDGFIIEMGFGGSASKYAFVVHERPKSVGQGKNKYLFKAVRDRTITMQAEIASWMAGMS